MRALQIAKQMKEAREAYYNGNPILGDAEYDALEDELRQLDPHHPILKQIGAAPPTSSGWPKVQHGQSMSSLNKVQTQDEMSAWWASCRPQEVMITEKLDGISCSMRFEQGVMVQALTRGDGLVGEDITRNVLMMKGYPKQMPIFTGYVRGEIICRKSDFVAHFPGESNPRNTASGTAKRQSDPDKCQYLTVISYQYLSDIKTITTKTEELKTLEDLGFTVPNYYVGNSPQWAKGVYDGYVSGKRDQLDYEIDGLVLEVDNTWERDDLGDKNNRPMGATAFKFPHEAKPTILRDIRWQVGNSGRVTPVAIFDTVVMGGRKIARASLAGVEQVERLRLFKGCNVMVSLRNDVIPRIESNLDEGTHNL